MLEKQGKIKEGIFYGLLNCAGVSLPFSATQYLKDNHAKNGMMNYADALWDLCIEPWYENSESNVDLKWKLRHSKSSEDSISR